MSKYSPLQEFLINLPSSKNSINLSFREVEEILEFRLPQSAHKYNAWWANDKTSTSRHSESWLSAKFEVKLIRQNMTGGEVRFERQK